MLKAKNKHDMMIPRDARVVMVTNNGVDTTVGTIFSMIESGGGDPSEKEQGRSGDATRERVI